MRAMAALRLWMVMVWLCHGALGIREAKGESQDPTFCHHQSVRTQDIEESEILKPLSHEELQDVFQLMEQRHHFKAGLEKALKAAKASEGVCPSQGRWKDMGCAPFPKTLAELKCNCPAFLGFLPRSCMSHREREGELEENLDFQTAREIYAGVCSLNTHGIHRKALGIIALVGGIIAAWCVVSGRAADEFGAAQDEVSHSEEEESATDDVPKEEEKLQKAEENRQKKFEKMVADSKTLRELVIEVSKEREEPPESFTFTPVKSNIYRFWALGGKKRSWLAYFGLRFVLLIQLVAPFAILRENYFKWDWKHCHIQFVQYEFGSLNHGVSHLLGRLLQLCFIYCIGLHSLSIVRKAAQENSMLSALFDELKRRKDDNCAEGKEDVFVDRLSQWCLLLDCLMICYVITVGLVDMVAIFSTSEGPKDVVFDSLALLFIFHLHEVEGGLAFVKVQDFDERRMGELCARISRDPDEKDKQSTELTKKEKLAKQRNQRRSALFFLTEMLIYIILLLVPVYQLFIQDGLAPRETSISEGVLGSHIVQEEALLAALRAKHQLP